MTETGFETLPPGERVKRFGKRGEVEKGELATDGIKRHTNLLCPLRFDVAGIEASMTYELHTFQVGIFRVSVEEDALQKLFVDLAAVVVSLHLHLRVILGAVEADDVDVELLDSKLTEPYNANIRASFQDLLQQEE